MCQCFNFIAKYSIIWIIISFTFLHYYCIVFYLPIHNLVDIGLLLVLAIMNDAAMNVCVQVLHGCMFSFLLGLYLGMKLLGHKVTLC